MRKTGNYVSVAQENEAQDAVPKKVRVLAFLHSDVSPVIGNDLQCITVSFYQVNPKCVTLNPLT